MLTAADLQQIWNEIKDCKVVMMTSEDGLSLRSRPMYLVQESFEGHLWFFTRRDSHKTVEVAQDSRVNLAFVDQSNNHYVSVSGNARITSDRALIDELWNPMVDVWFPEGKHSTEVALLEVEVHDAQIWDSTTSKMRQLFEIARAKATDTPPDMGENRKIS